MPNHVTNNITLSGNGAVELMNNLFMNDDREITEDFISFNHVHPMPSEIRNTTSPNRESDSEKSIRLRAKYGVDNWYDWASENWGTKWGVYDGYRIDDVTCYCQSAWATPYDGLLAISIKYPDVEIEVEYADEDFGHNVGRYKLKNGNEIESFTPQGGSEEAIELAIKISGGEYYLDEYISDVCNEDEFKDELKDTKGFISIILGIIYKGNLVPSGKYVCEELKRRALEDEKYEYIIELDKEINLVV